ncbi:hypothetical protein [Streptomyces sp. NPDC097619]|uniref:hypothetical protein n=1 Tax=Streptomyces sp. NPDC097619 TaxID=3157228 RepID=UPI0033319374
MRQLNPLRALADRTVLAVAGLVLSAGGAWQVAAWGPIADRLPVSRTGPDPGGPVLDRSALADLRSHPWWDAGTLTAGVAVTILLSAWLLTRVPLRRSARLPLTAKGTALRVRALEEVLTERAEDVEGIGRCRTRIRVHRRTLRVRLRVRLDPGTSPETLRAPLTDLVTEVATAAAPYRVHAHLHLGHRRHRAPRVR